MLAGEQRCSFTWFHACAIARVYQYLHFCSICLVQQPNAVGQACANPSKNQIFQARSPRVAFGGNGFDGAHKKAGDAAENGGSDNSRASVGRAGEGNDGWQGAEDEVAAKRPRISKACAAQHKRMMPTTIQRHAEGLPAGYEQRKDGVAVLALLLPEFNLRQRLGLKHRRWHQCKCVHASAHTLRINLSSVSSSLLILFTTLSRRVPATPNRLNSSRTLGEGGGQMQRCRKSRHQ